jgi:hypothetical protein
LILLDVRWIGQQRSVDVVVPRSLMHGRQAYHDQGDQRGNGRDPAQAQRNQGAGPIAFEELRPLKALTLSPALCAVLLKRGGAMPARSISLVGVVGLLPTFSPEIVPLNPVLQQNQGDTNLPDRELPAPP